jgi:cell division protein FtsA
MHVVTADVGGAQPDAGGRALPSRRRGDGGEPYVAGLSVLADDEADLGAAVIDMGAGTTTMAVFSGGRFVHADGFALGGQHVTMDIARGSTRASPTPSDQDALRQRARGRIGRARHDHGAAGRRRRARAPQFVSRAQLVRIIKPRVEEILEMVRDRLARSPFAAEPRGRVVLTGGASQLTGLPSSPRRFSAAGAHRPAARHRRAAGGSQGTGFRRRAGCWSTRSGASRTFRTAANAALDDRDGGYIARVGRWLRESF